MFLRTLAALLFILSTSTAVAQTDEGLPGPRECLDDDHANRCDPEVQARVRDLLGVASIEDEAAAGGIVYRAFFVNGYGSDMPAVAFERRPGQSPEVVIYGREGRSTRAPVSSEAWEQIESEARIADRVMAPLIPEPEDDPDDTSISICLHAWVQTVEIANAPRERFADEPVRRRVESACDYGLTSRFAFRLADLAVEQIPWCHRIDEANERNSVTRLNTCLFLAGDRIAAADLHNARLADVEWRGDDDVDATDWRGRLGINNRPLLTWNGEAIRSNGDWRNDPLIAFLLARFEEHPDLEFYPVDLEGLDARHVIVTGEVGYGFDETLMVADYQQTWEWDLNALQWMLTDWTVGPFAPAPTGD